MLSSVSLRDYLNAGLVCKEWNQTIHSWEFCKLLFKDHPRIDEISKDSPVWSRFISRRYQEIRATIHQNFVSKDFHFKISNPASLYLRIKYTNEWLKIVSYDSKTKSFELFDPEIKKSELFFTENLGEGAAHYSFLSPDHRSVFLFNSEKKFIKELTFDGKIQIASLPPSKKTLFVHVVQHHCQSELLAIDTATLETKKFQFSGTARLLSFTEQHLAYYELERVKILNLHTFEPVGKIRKENVIEIISENGDFIALTSDGVGTQAHRIAISEEKIKFRLLTNKSGHYILKPTYRVHNIFYHNRVLFFACSRTKKNRIYHHIESYSIDRELSKEVHKIKKLGSGCFKGYPLFSATSSKVYAVYLQEKECRIVTFEHATS